MRGSLNEGAFVNEGLDHLLLENVVGGEFRCQRCISTAVSLRLSLVLRTESRVVFLPCHLSGVENPNVPRQNLMLLVLSSFHSSLLICEGLYRTMLSWPL